MKKYKQTYNKSGPIGNAILLFLIGFSIICIQAEFVFASETPYEINPFAIENVLPDNKGLELSIGQVEYDQLRYKGDIIIRDFSLDVEKTVDLELTQFYVFDSHSEFVAGTANGDSAVSAPDVLLFQGTVAGNPESRVFLGLSSHCSNGYIHHNGTMYYISSNKNQTDDDSKCSNMIISDEKNIQFTLDPERICRTICEGGPDISESLNEKGDRPRIQPFYLVRAALDGTYSYYQFMGSDLDAALAYIVELVAAASVIYERDMFSKLWIRYHRVWTTTDPFLDDPDSLELSDFAQYWNDNMSHITRNFATKITASYSGGVSYVASGGLLCLSGSAYSVCDMDDGSFPNPINTGDEWWDLLVCVHEWGHTFGAYHTHCYSPPLDSCYNQQDGCYDGTEICRRGTIMSYCHLCSEDYIGNMDPWFHIAVANAVLINLDNGCLLFASDTCYVDGDWTGQEFGTVGNPWNSAIEGVRGVSTGGLLRIKSNNYPEAFEINRPLRIERWGSSGSVIIGE